MGRLPRTDAGNPLRAYLKEQRRLQRQQGYASAFSRSGLNVTADGQLGSDDFDGDIPNRDAGTQGWGASGGTLAAGDLLLRPRSIGDDSLSSLIGPGFVAKSDGNFAVTPAGTLVAAGDLIIPDGFTGAMVTVTCNASANNTTSSLDYLYVSSNIEGPDYGGPGGEAFASVPAGAWGNASASSAMQIVGLTAGQTITCSVRVRSGTTWSAQAANIANMNATVTWYR